MSLVDWNDKNYIKGFPLEKILRNGQKYSISAKIFSLCGNECVGFIFMLSFTAVNYKGKIVFYKNLACRKCCLFLIVILFLDQRQRTK